MGFADLHIHSVHSHDGTCSIPAILKYVADHTDLDVIAITDHNTVDGVREAVRLGSKYGIEVIPGCEVTTAQGHLLALFITQPVPSGLSLVETLKFVGRIGGLCAVPHPEAANINGLKSHVVREALDHSQAAKVLVGIETYNGSLFFSGTNHVAEMLGRSLNLSCLGSSDSHILETIGQGTTEFEGRTASDFRRALEEHSTIPHKVPGLSGIEVMSRWFPKYLLRKMGWVAWNAEPQEPLKYVRMKRALAGVSQE